MPEGFEHFAKDYSFIMGLVDFIPVILFAIAGCILIKAMFNNIKKPFAVMLCSGVTLGLTAGIFKATWKILVALNICDFYPLNFMFLPTESLGFVLIGIALFSVIFDKNNHKPKNKAMMIALPMMLPIALVLYEASPVKLYDGSILFIMMLIIGTALIVSGLSYLSIKNKRWYCVILFVFTFIFLMIMGAMKPISRNMNETLANWIEELVNIAAQVTLLVGCLILNKKGFFSFRESK